MRVFNINTIDNSNDLLEFALREYESALIGYAYGIVNDVDRARDIVQDTFIKLYQQDVDKVRESLKTWLYTVCRNRAIDTLRKDRRLVFVEDEGLSHQASSQGNPEGQMVHKEKMQQVMKSVSSLSENQQTVIQLKFQKGLSYQEISEQTGLTTGNVGFLLHHAIKKIKESLPANFND